jgi:hypothetical protein
MTNVKLAAEKGRTIQRGEEWSKEVYTLEIEVDDSQLEETRAWAISTIDRWLEEMGPAREAAGIPYLDTAELAKLPFKKFKEKDAEGKAVACGPNSPGWIFTDTKGAEAIVKAVREAKGSLVVGEWNYKITGSDGQFLQPAKKV